MNILILGPAGSGKTSLVKAFADWIKKNQKLKIACVNLDPGAELLPYSASFDIRKFFTVKSIMKEEKLGPNGALVRAMELMMKEKNKIEKELKKIKADLKLIDSPGQLELFVFHRASEIVKIFEPPIVGIFLIPAELANPIGIAVTQFLSLATQLRLEIPCVNVFSKVDLVENHEELSKLILKPEKLKKEIERTPLGVEKDLAVGAAKLTSKIVRVSRIVKTSAKTKEGLEELYDVVHELLCACGEI